jgi:uncharacterized protein YggT (Ycf19 family)
MPRRDDGLTVVGFCRVVLWLVWAWVVLDLVLLGLAFVLRVFGANPDTDFTEWVYRSVERAMAPFRGIFEPIELTDSSVLDTSLLFAMIVYGIVALFLRAGLDWLSRWIARRRYDLAVDAAQRLVPGPAHAVVGVTVAAPPQPAAATSTDGGVPATG